jgi:hypothetical protein
VQKTHTIKNKMLDVKKAISKHDMDRFRNDQRSMMGGSSYGGGSSNYGSGYGRGQSSWGGGGRSSNNGGSWGQWSNDSYANNGGWSNDSGPWDSQNNWSSGSTGYGQSWSNDSFGNSYQPSYSSSGGPMRGRSYGGGQRSVPYSQSKFELCSQMR